MTTTARRTEIVDFLGREVQVYEPTDTQKAVIAQIARSSRVELITKIARVVDLIESWFVVEADREWFADNMLGGDWDFVDEVLPMMITIGEAFGADTNREDRRTAAKATKKAVRKAAK